MKRKYLVLIVLISIFAFIGSVKAVDMAPSEVPNGGYVVGEYLYITENRISSLSQDLQDLLQQHSSDSVFGESGNDIVTGRHLMLGATTIISNDYDDMIVYGKSNRGNSWSEPFQNRAFNSDELPSQFHISYINGICVLPQGCGSNTDSYNVSFYEGDTLVTSKPVVYGNKMSASDVPSLEKDGYKFICWTENLDAQNVTCYNFGVVTAPVNLYAYYEPINLKLTYHYKAANGNDITSNTYTCNVANSDNDVCKFNIGQNLPTVPRGYEFIGWSTSQESKDYVYKSGDSLVSLASGSENIDIDLYAVYKEIEYSVTYNLNGGSYEDDLKTMFTASGTGNVVFDFKPVKEGYKINNNSVTVTNGSYNTTTKKITISNPNVGGHTVTVTWEPIAYTIKSGNSTIATCTYGVDCSVNPPSQIPAGKEFIGYSTDENNSTNLFKGKVKNLTTVDNSVVNVYPKYTNKKYSVNYDLKEGKLVGANMSDLAVTYDIDHKTVSLPALSKDGYVFNGWKVSYDTNTLIDSTTWPKSFTINTSNSINNNNEGDITFTAQFRPITYLFRYHKSGNQVEPKTFSSDQGSYTIEDVGYTPGASLTFVGWGSSTTNPTYAFKTGVVLTLSEVVQLAGNGNAIELYPYTVTESDKVVTMTYDPNGGTFASFDSINTRFVLGNNGTATVTLPTVEERDGYTFIGWKVGDQQYPANQTTITISANTKAVAQWHGVTSNVTLHDNYNHTCQFSYQYGDPAIKLEDKIDPTNCSSFVDENLIGWAISSTGNLYYGRDVLINNITSNTDFYAVYEEDSRYVVGFYDGNNQVGRAMIDGGYTLDDYSHVEWINTSTGFSGRSVWLGNTKSGSTSFELASPYEDIIWKDSNDEIFTSETPVESDMNVYVSTDDNWHVVRFFNGTEIIGIARVSPGHYINFGDTEWDLPLIEGYGQERTWLYPKRDVFSWDTPIYKDTDVYLGDSLDTATDRYTVTFYKGFGNKPRIIGEAVVDSGRKLKDGEDVVTWTTPLPEGYGAETIWHMTKENSENNIFYWNQKINLDYTLYTN